MHFARLLRAAGLRLGPDRVVDCVQALELADCNRRDDWYWTMSAVFLSKEEQRPIFDQAFRIFWRDPKLVEKMMNALLPKTYGRAGKPEQEQSQRLSDALFDQKKTEQAREEQKIELDARLTFSSREVLQRMDFDTMSAAELAEAKKMIARPAPAAAVDPHAAQQARSSAENDQPARDAARVAARGRRRDPAGARGAASRSTRRWWCCATSRAR